MHQRLIAPVALLAVAALALPVSFAAPALAQGRPTPYPLPDAPVMLAGVNADIKVSVVAQGIPRPFGFAVLPDGDMLITDRYTPALRIIRDDALDPEPLQGLPDIRTGFHSGLLDEEAGALPFLRFIQKELKPLIENHYPVDPNNSTLQGISLGGLFGAWVLLNEPGTFNNYILGSPAIWWRNEEVWQWEGAYAENHNDLPAKVFIGAGALEIEENLRADALAIAEKNPMLCEQIKHMIAWNDAQGWPEVAKLAPQLASQMQLRRYPSLRIHSHIFPDENHMSVMPAISSRGLRYVFGSWEP